MKSLFTKSFLDLVLLCFLIPNQSIIFIYCLFSRLEFSNARLEIIRLRIRVFPASYLWPRATLSSKTRFLSLLCKRLSAYSFAKPLDKSWWQTFHRLFSRTLELLALIIIISYQRAYLLSVAEIAFVLVHFYSGRLVRSVGEGLEVLVEVES